MSGGAGDGYEIALAALNVIQAVMLAWLASGPPRARRGADRRSNRRPADRMTRGAGDVD